MLHDPLRSLLSRYPSKVQPVSDVRWLAGAGGLSGALIWRYASAMGELAVRAWPKDGSSIAHVMMIHGWIQEASGSGFLPLAVPLAALDGQTVSELGGRCFEIAPWMAGAPDLACPPDVNHVCAALTALALFHRRLGAHSTVQPSPGLRYRINELEGLAAGGFDRLEAALERCQDESLADPARQWILLARAALPRLLPWLRDLARLDVTVQPCLRDARPEHFLFDGERLSGIIDFGAMGHETVAADLARLMGAWLANSVVLRAEAMAAYERIRPLDPLERTFIAAFETVADVLIAGHWISWHFIERRTFDDPEAVRRGISRGLQRLQRLAHRNPGRPG